MPLISGCCILLKAAVVKGLEEFIGGLAFLLLAVSLIIAYSHSLGGSVW